MCGVVLDVVVPVVFRHEPQNESVAEAVLQILHRIILPACDGYNVRSPRVRVDTRLLQTEKLGRDLCGVQFGFLAVRAFWSVPP